MKAREVRKGNLAYKINRNYYIHLPIEIPLEIVKIGIFEVDVINQGENIIYVEEYQKVSFFDLSPIEITEEWLLKLGFEKKSKKWKDGSVSEDLFIKGNFFIRLHNGYNTFSKFDFNYEQVFLTNVDYVHQLQNLYFALTNEELTL
ncbi:MAG: hypothetical protein E2590_12735 [Chryseobacterium sp.]|nr:hypothetical protein [Chryseobacterium sp.]